MDFWDHLNMAMMLSVRDYYRDKEKIARNQKRFYQKCREELADYSSELFNVVTDVSVKANPNFIPNEITSGAAMLTLYAPYMVLRAQGGMPTAEQTRYLDIFFKCMTLSISKYDFLAATRGNSAAQKEITDLVGVSDDYCGTFWVAFFKSMYATNSDEETLTRVMDIFASIVMRFSILGRPQSEVALPICESFMHSVQRQIVECRKLPENPIDIIGEVPACEHKRRIENLAMSLLYAAGDQNELDMDDLLPFFFIGSIRDMIEMTTASEYEKAKMLDHTIKTYSIKTELSGFDIYQLIEQNHPAGEMFLSISKSMFEIIATLATKSDRHDDFSTFVQESTGFLSGVEQELYKENRYCGLGKLAGKCMAAILKEFENLIKD